MWVLVVAIAAALGYWVWHAMRKYGEKQRAEEERFAGFIAQTVNSSFTKPEEAAALAQQKLLFEAAAKAAEANEAALAIQLYARLLARYPESRLAEQARPAVEQLKAKLKARIEPPRT